MRITDPASRRDLLRTLAAVGAAGVLAGCDLLATPAPDPDPLLGFLARTKALVNAYSTAIGSAPPALVTIINPIRDAHRAHVAALEALIKPPSPSAGAGAPSAAASGTPGDPKVALLALEKEGAKLAYETCLVVPAARATLLGEIAAARAAHVTVLS
ncbi:hypothetical protein F4553_005714 [Allocatelliglobosispora scoriae]|uniref:Twin-arginine translocation signal domain-containing protein n=1 Tax=Allocatelliglobosispora scoriae TaxID=643052 RepID=A0A841BZZ7_9ACTN|nr:twin-arginine translocation signal domain-containing protein [Allocatelliglobosispora scoriae]MBB5872280.1 hypothetical protein [Allocatelliglobosispora scoriae]